MVRDDGGAGTAEPCPCRAVDRVPRLLAAAGLPARYAGLTLDNFQTNHGDAGERDQRLEALGVSRRYVDEFVTGDGHFTEFGLLYVGPPGAGKTHLAVGVLGELIRRYGVVGKFVDFTALIHRIQSSFDRDSPDTKSGILSEVTAAEVLVLDELGAQKPSEWVSQILYLVMNDRYTCKRPTLFTTNYGVEEPAIDRFAGDSATAEWLGRRIPRNLLSRLYEMTRPITLQVRDFRHDVKMARHPF